MKYSKLLSLSLGLASFCMSANQLPLLKKDAIAKKAVAIQAHIARDRYIVYGITALSIAHELYQWAPLITRYLLNVPQAPLTTVATETLQKEKAPMIQACKAAVTSLCHNTAQGFKEGFSFLFYTKDGWVSIANAGMSIGGYLMISKIGDTFIHPDTLHWYVHTYAPYELTIQLMKEASIKLQDPSISVSQKVYNIQLLEDSVGRLVRHGESICAYMAYKAQRLDDEEKAIAKRAVRCMIKTQNDWLQSISVQLSADSKNYEVLDKLLLGYESAIASQLNHFSVVEGETRAERRAVKIIE